MVFQILQELIIIIALRVSINSQLYPPRLFIMRNSEGFYLLHINNYVSYANNSGFLFNPSRSPSFNPTGNNISGNDANPNGIDDNMYVPRCGDNISRDTYRNQVGEYVTNFGQSISYWGANYNYAEHTFIYGESPTGRFFGPRRLKAVIDFSSYTTFLTKFGIMSDADIKIYIAIQEFTKVWGTNRVPFAGDVFVIDDSACDRPLKQSPIDFDTAYKTTLP